MAKKSTNLTYGSDFPHDFETHCRFCGQIHYDVRREENK